MYDLLSAFYYPISILALVVSDNNVLHPSLFVTDYLLMMKSKHNGLLPVPPCYRLATEKLVL